MMLRAGLVSLLSFGLSCPVLAQAQPSHESLARDSAQASQKLRIEKLKERALTLPVDETTKSKLLLSNDKELLQAAIKDRSKLEGNSLARNLAARTSLIELADLAADQRVTKALLASGIDPGKVRIAAVSSRNPTEELANLSKRLGVGTGGRILVKGDDVLITNPERNFSDKLQPGVVGNDPQVPGDKGVWRSGLKFAVLIGMQDGTNIVGHCSGTFLPGNWVVTAAHCLVSRRNGGQVGAQNLHVYFPFQAGTDSVTSPSGFINRGMKRLKVEETVWLGQFFDQQFPASIDSFGSVIADGLDLALLRLNAAEVAALPNPIPRVKIYSGDLVGSSVSALGYGVSNVADFGDLSLLVGVRTTLPEGAEELRNVLYYGKNQSDKAGGICGGDSGGGLFFGRIDGQGSDFRLIGVVSSLLGNGQNSASSFCLASTQSHTSLITNRNRQFVCNRVPVACS